jgi:glycine oxidase
VAPTVEPDPGNAGVGRHRITDPHHELDVVVAGGGPIGLSIAWRAAARGLSTAVVDAGEPGAWQVAAGMLAPATEAEFGEDALSGLGLRSAERFEDFCRELAEAAGRDPGLRRAGTLAVAGDADEAEALERLLAYRVERGLPVERLRPSQARRLEPALAPTVRFALLAPRDHSVDPRTLVAALREALDRAGVQRIDGRAERVTHDGERVTGLALEGGRMLPAAQVVVATGANALDVPDAVPVRPVKGQVLRLRDRRGAGLVERTIRGADAYLVPRADGRYVLGATMEEQGFDRTPTAGGVYELLRDIADVVPGVLELDVEEVLAGLRPATPDNLPAIGPGTLAGLHWAVGHFRNGILLAPVTADLVAGALAGEELPAWAACCDPRRFAKAYA